ncbi:MAG: transglycosylase SLT domain-containing protein [Anaerolineales bacterium]
MRATRAIVWLPVILAASFPLGLLTAWASALPGRSSPSREDSQTSTARIPASASISPAFTKEVQHWDPDIGRWAGEYDLPADLIATVMQIESCGHPQVESTAGAIGLFQVMPFHFGAGEDPLLPEVNAARGLSYLARGFELAGGELGLTLAGYNGGHGLIARPSAVWPSETQRYVRWGSRILEDMRTGTIPSPGLAAWLDAGGASLCRRAAAALGID